MPEKLLACVPGDHPFAGGQGRLIVYASNARLAQMTNRASDKTVTRLISEPKRAGLWRGSRVPTASAMPGPRRTGR